MISSDHGVHKYISAHREHTYGSVRNLSVHALATFEIFTLKKVLDPIFLEDLPTPSFFPLKTAMDRSLLNAP